MYYLFKKKLLSIGIALILIGSAFLLYDSLLLFYKLIIILDYVGFISISIGTIFVCIYIASEDRIIEKIDIELIIISIVLFCFVVFPQMPIPNIVEGLIVLFISPFILAMAIFHISGTSDSNTKFIFPLSFWAAQLLYYTIWEGINYSLGYIIDIENSSNLFLLDIMAPIIFSSFFEVYNRKKQTVVG